MSDNKTNYIKIYPKTKKLKDSITKLARRNDMTTSGYIIEVMKKEMEKEVEEKRIKKELKEQK
tara:strand:+ start:316 stop:504 length:189 start_codon:yes stop_codon:yes gene_type:complete